MNPAPAWTLLSIIAAALAIVFAIGTDWKAAGVLIVISGGLIALADAADARRRPKGD